MVAYALWHTPHHTVCTVMRLIGPIFYRVRARGHEHLPEGGGLVVCNHLSYVDAVVLQIASPRPLRFVAFAGFVKSPFMRFVFRAAGVIPVNANKPMKGIRMAVDAIAKGELVCIFPEGAISRTGQLMMLRRGFELIARQAHAPVIPAVIDGLWGSVYSFAETIRRLMEKIDRTMEILNRGGVVDEEAGTADEEYEYLEGKYEIEVDHLRVADYLYDLEGDKIILEKIYNDAKSILDENRDLKIRTLQDEIVKKVT